VHDALLVKWLTAMPSPLNGLEMVDTWNTLRQWITGIAFGHPRTRTTRWAPRGVTIIMIDTTVFKTTLSVQEHCISWDSREATLGHHVDDGSNKFRWTFEAVPGEDGWYYIKEVDSNTGIVAGFVADGNVYIQDPTGRDDRKWKAVPIPGKASTYWMYEKMHALALIAGTNYGGNVYHQDPNGRLNAEWTLTIPVDGTTGTSSSSGSSSTNEESVTDCPKFRYHRCRVQQCDVVRELHVGASHR
jgi:hypothetical protein